jgi:hypothetical protein
LDRLIQINSGLLNLLLSLPDAAFKVFVFRQQPIIFLAEILVVVLGLFGSGVGFELGTFLVL